MTTHALRTWHPLPTPLRAFIDRGDTVVLLAFAFERDTLIYVATDGQVLTASEVIVQATP